MPLALGIMLCSLVPVGLLTCVEHIEITDSMWAVRHEVTPFISWTFGSIYLMGLGLPALAAGVAVWFLVGGSPRNPRFGWVLVALVALHLFWLSYGLLALYLANQNFKS